MLLFGHLGLTLGVARALSRESDARWVAVAALLPDLLDKPLRVLAPAFTQGNTRTVGHALTVMLVCMVLVAFPLRRLRGARGVALVLPVHLLLDGMWGAGYAGESAMAVGRQCLSAPGRRRAGWPLG